MWIWQRRPAGEGGCL